MAKYGAAQVAFALVDGYSIAGVLTEFADEIEVVTEDAKGLGEAWPEPTPTGDRRGSLTQNGFYDDAALSINEALCGNQGVARVVNYGVEGNTIGKAAVGMAGSYASKFTRISTKDALTKANASYAVSGAVEAPVILHDLSEEAGDGNTEGAESVNSGAGTVSGASGYLQVAAITLSGRPNVTFKVRDSTDDITYADLVTFTAVSARTAERVTVAGTVDQYLACSWAWGGAGGAPTVTFLIGLHRNPDPA